MNLNIILGAVLAVILSFGAGYYKGSNDEEASQAIEIAKANEVARAKEQKIIVGHNEITKSTLGEKDAIEKNRILFNAQYSATFGLRQSSSGLSVGSNSTSGIGGKTLRFSEADAQFLNNFAAECQSVEAERNEVILKYEALK